MSVRNIIQCDLCGETVGADSVLIRIATTINHVPAMVQAQYNVSYEESWRAVRFDFCKPCADGRTITSLLGLLNK